jgi:hypothetical protein
VGSTSGSANIEAVLHFLPHSTKYFSSDRCSSFPDSLFQVLNVVNMKTVDNLLHASSEIKIQGCQVRRVWGRETPPMILGHTVCWVFVIRARYCNWIPFLPRNATERRCRDWVAISANTISRYRNACGGLSKCWLGSPVVNYAVHELPVYFCRKEY